MSDRVSFASVSLSFARASKERNIYKRLVTRAPATRKVLFENLNLAIEAGETVALVGPNGSGKTTLLKLAAGIFVPETGEVQIGDELQPQVRREKLGLMLNTQLLYDGLTGYQNLDYTAHLYACQDLSSVIQEAVSFWGMEEYIDASVRSYSAGMKARLALARATLHRPSVLLLDEPTVFLDLDGLTRLKHYLRTSPVTAVITTHQETAFAEVLNRVIPIETLETN